MRIILNILWFIFGGLVSWLGMVLAGILFCITIIGIPFGKQCFKIAGLIAWPFGKDVTYHGGVGSTIGNILWVLLIGWESALVNLILGVVLCITIIGIPWGKQYFKIAALTFLPFGAEIKTAHVF